MLAGPVLDWGESTGAWAPRNQTLITRFTQMSKRRIRWDGEFQAEGPGDGFRGWYQIQYLHYLQRHKW